MISEYILHVSESSKVFEDHSYLYYALLVQIATRSNEFEMFDIEWRDARPTEARHNTIQFSTMYIRLQRRCVCANYQSATVQFSLRVSKLNHLNFLKLDRNQTQLNHETFKLKHLKKFKLLNHGFVVQFGFSSY